jgi:hypothetical protein
MRPGEARTMPRTMPVPPTGEWEYRIGDRDDVLDRSSCLLELSKMPVVRQEYHNSCFGDWRQPALATTRSSAAHGELVQSVAAAEGEGWELIYFHGRVPVFQRSIGQSEPHQH